MDIIMSDLVGTADNMGVTALVQDMLEDSILDRKIQERWIADIEKREAREALAQAQVDFAAFKVRQETYLKACQAVLRSGSLAWIGAVDDIYVAQRLFAKNAIWRDSVADADYDRLSAVMDARA